MKKGIDVSKYQGKINFEKVKKAGIEFVIIRAGWGQGNIDPMFERNIKECNRLGIPCGIYWFSYAYTMEMAKREALAALKAVKPYKLDYPIWFDFEYDSVSYAAKKGVNVTKELASNMARAFMREIKAAGYQAGNYTNLDFSQRMFSADIMKDHDVWAARYISKKTDIVNASALWQYSNSEKVDGIVGKVDCNYALKDYGKVVVENVPDVPIQTQIAGDSYKIPTVYNLIFDADFYLKKYKDLQSAVADWIIHGTIHNTKEAIDWQLFQHFYAFGMNEKRAACATFNVEKYRAAYPDLDAAFGDEWMAYYFHYMQLGADEIAKGTRKIF